MSGGFRAVIRVGSGKAVYKDGSIETILGVYNVKSVSVDSVLTMLAACFSRSIVENLQVPGVEVLVELYEDLDAILDGDVENSNQLMVKVRVRGASSKAVVERALERCPFYNMLKRWIRVLEVELQ